MWKECYNSGWDCNKPDWDLPTIQNKDELSASVFPPSKIGTQHSSTVPPLRKWFLLSLTTGYVSRLLNECEIKATTFPFLYYYGFF